MMWWFLGGSILIVGLWIARRLRRASHHVQLVQAAQSHIRVIAASLQPFGGLDERVWHDRYLLGFIQGSIAIMTAVFVSTWSTERKGMIMVDAIHGLVGEDYKQVLDRMFGLAEKRDESYQRGMDEGANVAILMADRAGSQLLADPDVQMALRDGPELQKMTQGLFGDRPTGQTGSAGAALMHMYLRRHKVEAGY